MDHYAVKSPLLLVVFNRPEQTRELFDVVAQVEPQFLYVAADAPRESKRGEALLCKKTLAIFDAIDWPCRIMTKVNKVNLGSYSNIPKAVDWFFENEEEGIVLEDDCIPSVSFFRYCDVLLSRHRSEKRIMWINGSNLGYERDGAATYGYSSYTVSWGWASWRVSWQMFGGEFRHGPKPLTTKSIIKRRFSKSLLRNVFWRSVFDYAYRVRNWDYRFLLTMWANDGVACTPFVNLVRNVGFGIDGMHREKADDPRGHIPEKLIFGTIDSPIGEAEADQNVDWYMEEKLHWIGYGRALRFCVASRLPYARPIFRYMKHRFLKMYSGPRKLGGKHR